MQILHAGDIPMVFDHHSRPADENNPKGYFELAGGKIINELTKKSFPFDDYKGQFIKITAYGLQFLPPGNYKIIYSQRNIEEILDSMEKMAKIKDEDRDETRHIFSKLNDMIIEKISRRDDIDTLFINFKDIMDEPQTNTKRICDFLGVSDDNLERMINCVDKKLYRNRR